MKRCIWITTLGILSLTIVVLPLFIQADATLTGRQIMENVQDRDRPDSMVAQSQMIINKGSNVYEKLFTAYSIEIDDDTGYTLMDFTYPSRIKFLSHSYENEEDDQWILMSGDNTPRRIASSDKTNPFLSSHINYEDMDLENLDNFDFERLPDGSIPFGPFVGVQCYKVSAIKTSGNPTNYGKIVFYVRKSDYMVLRTEFYDKELAPLKVMNILEMVEDQGFDIVLQTKIQIANQQDQFTVLTVEGYEINVDIDQSMFRRENMAR